MSRIIKHIGLDDHKDTISIGIAEAGIGEARYFGQIDHRPEAVRKAMEKLSAGGAKLVCWYEAGPCGYGLYRQLRALGHACHVVAPSLTPRRAGQRIKTDRRDGLTLARLGRAGELTPVWVPDAAHEAVRDLTRCREDAVAMQRQARQQLGAFLLRHGRRYDQGRKKWTRMFFDWLDTQKFEDAVAESVFNDYVTAVWSASQRVAQLERRMEELLPRWELGPVVEGLVALRGVDTVTAMTLVAELGDVRRFASPRQLMSYLGLVPSESSSGRTTRRGGITKTGNRHARRVLVEAAWCYRHPARMTRHMRKKADRAPAAAQAIALKAQHRLCKRYRRLTERGKLKVQACTAVARELSGFVWAIAREVWPKEAGGA